MYRALSTHWGCSHSSFHLNLFLTPNSKQELQSGSYHLIIHEPIRQGMIIISADMALIRFSVLSDAKLSGTYVP